ncbi:MAG: anti-sigma regulatory factor [Planctomycetes bacterium]|nr:anti-sigma regulatory factor [Planctomycetota bacterium]MBL7040199.1 anti-sigma regulatory factor [Pirellulaceae bacterium]
MDVASSHIAIDICEWAHMAKARRRAAELATKLGFTEQAVGEVSIVMVELTENLVAHGAVRGRILLSVVEQGDRKGLQIISEDSGPGIADVSWAIQDGHSKKTTLGIGLGAVKRLMDEFDIISQTERKGTTAKADNKQGIGTVVGARKWLPAQGAETTKPAATMSFGIMSRPVQGETANGDGYFLKYDKDAVLVATIDGLGHGPDAEAATREATATLADESSKPLDVILASMHKRLRKTRGVAVSLARIRPVDGTMDYAGVGNVVTRVYNSPQPVRPVNFNGIVGANLRQIRVYQYPWHAQNVLIMTSDGISEKYDPDSYPGLLGKHPMIISSVLLRDFGRENDDATVAVGAKP